MVETIVIASGTGTNVSSANNIPFESGKIYEHRIQVWAFPEFSKFLIDIQNALFSSGAELIDNRIEGNTIIYRFKKSSRVQTQIAPVLGAVIAIVLGLIALFIIKWTLAEVIIPIGIDIFKLALIGLGIVAIVAGGAILLRKSKVLGEKPIFNR